MEPKRSAVAWQPFTPRGVAAFAGARFSRLLAVQGVVALCSALVVAWVISHAWFQAIDSAIKALPQKAEIRRGVLAWPEPSPQRLAENPFLALAVDLGHTGQVRSPAHVLLEFGQRDVRIISLFGYLTIPYPMQWVFAFSRDELLPAWGAWSAPALALITLGVLLGLLLLWGCLAAVYAGPLWLTAFFLNRDLNWHGTWRIAGAALMPGAAFMTLMLALYGLGICDPVRLLLAVMFHFAIGIFYAIAGTVAAPAINDQLQAKANPFVASPPKAP